MALKSSEAQRTRGYCGGCPRLQHWAALPRKSRSLACQPISFSGFTAEKGWGAWLWAPDSRRPGPSVPCNFVLQQHLLYKSLTVEKTEVGGGWVAGMAPVQGAAEAEAEEEADCQQPRSESGGTHTPGECRCPRGARCCWHCPAAAAGRGHGAGGAHCREEGPLPEACGI